MRKQGGQRRGRGILPPLLTLNYLLSIVLCKCEHQIERDREEDREQK